jgi:hypothetical protein
MRPARAHSSPVAATATPVSSAAEQQHEYDDNQDHLHWKPPFRGFTRPKPLLRDIVLDFGEYLRAKDFVDYINVRRTKQFHNG